MTVPPSLTEEASVRVVECAARALVGGDTDAPVRELLDWMLAEPDRVYHTCVAALATAAQLANKVAAQQGVTVDRPDVLWQIADVDEEIRNDPIVTMVCRTVVAFAKDDRAMGVDLIIAHQAVAGLAGIINAAAAGTGMVGTLLSADKTMAIGPPRKKKA